jgi:hypothetical protein
VEGCSQDAETDYLEGWVDFIENEGYADPMHLSDGCFHVEERHAQEHDSYHIGNQEDSSPVLVDEVGHSPESPEAHTEAHDTHDVAPLVAVDVRVVRIIGGF